MTIGFSRDIALWTSGFSRDDAQRASTRNNSQSEVGRDIAQWSITRKINILMQKHKTIEPVCRIEHDTGRLVINKLAISYFFASLRLRAKWGKQG